MCGVLFCFFLFVSFFFNTFVIGLEITWHVSCNMPAGLFFYFNLFLLSVASALVIVIGIDFHMCTRQGLKPF